MHHDHDGLTLKRQEIFVPKLIKESQDTTVFDPRLITLRLECPSKDEAPRLDERGRLTNDVTVAVREHPSEFSRHVTGIS